ncbi:MAG: HAD family phosphatase [Spirochaetales bacterium]|nr:HAD family phosphatase [Spirochaetales bacterium]
METINRLPPYPADAPLAMIITDLDGTLLNKERKCAPDDYETLTVLEKRGIIRVIATGRNFYSLCKVIKPPFPVDYVIFSSGAGVWHLGDNAIIRKISFDKDEVEKAASTFTSLNLDFFIHHPIPENHFFTYYGMTNDNPDFNRRISNYREFAEAGDPGNIASCRAAQLLAIIPTPDNETCRRIYMNVKARLPDFTVIRTTSPLDGASCWIEVFPGHVSKGKTAQWLCLKTGIKRENVCALGNDYNDTDLLAWAGRSFVVGNAADELKRQFPQVLSHNECGFSDAVSKWLSGGNKSV